MDRSTKHVEILESNYYESLQQWFDSAGWVRVGTRQDAQAVANWVNESGLAPDGWTATAYQNKNTWMAPVPTEWNVSLDYE